MESTFCVNCKQPLPAGAAFCGNCGAHQTPAHTAEPTNLTPPPTPLVAPLRATMPPDQDLSVSQYDASLPSLTSGRPWPPPSAAPGSGPSPSGPYATPQTPFASPPSPGHFPSPRAVGTPTGVESYAPPAKRSGRRFALGCLVALVLVVLLVGGGSVLAFRLLSSNKSSNTTSQHTRTTPGTASTPPPTSTPGGGQGAQTLNNLKLQAIYAGVTITVMGAIQAPTVPGYQPDDPSMDALRIQARLDNSQDTNEVYLTDYTTVVGANGTPYDIATTSLSDSLPGSIPARANVVGYWYFTVPQGTTISDWKVVIGQSNESLVTIPLNGANYDPSVWQWVTTTLTTRNTITYYGGTISGTVSKVTTGLWTPGYQAPQGMRFILVDLLVQNNSGSATYIGDPEFSLLLPGGNRESQNSLYGYFINDDLGANASKDEGYICFLAPPAKGDFQLMFFNKDNSVAGMIDLGTL